MKHQFNPINIFWVIILLGLILVACGPVSQQSEISTPLSGRALISGTIANLGDYWQTETVSVFLADYYENEDGKGFFTLDAYAAPIAQVQPNGKFSSSDLPPGTYVLVVGPTPEESRLIVQEDQAIDIA